MKRMISAIALVSILAACSSSDDGQKAVSTSAAATASTTTPTTEATTTTEPASTVPAAPPAAGDVVLTTVVGDLEHPVDMVWRDGDAEPFVVLQRGRIIRLHEDAVTDTVLDISADIGTEGEQGLLGLAFHPGNSLAYIFTTAANGALTVSEYDVDAEGVFSTASRRVVLRIEHPNGNHNGGKLAFGPDGYLYIGTGDGGAANDPDRNALDLSQLLGKILRIDPTATADGPYSVPDDNPFVGVDGARPEIWSYGLRNPWRFSFDEASGDLWIGDVGQGAWEEVDVARANQGGGRGTNFGWSAFEGTHRFNDDQSADGVTMPVYEYSHDTGGCAVTGGVVYRGDAIRSLAGWYVFSDFCTGTVWALRAHTGADSEFVELATGAGNPGAFAAAPDGTVYVLDHANSQILRLDPA